ncbi:hypothetical protein CSOJ01_08603 [Colletotrichum sojae]|uniref:Uncharacterized protein n=1 Tax=Colletotrichum sojae TaxID=2175907 RepID=A0A8H6J5Q0_9PEZI|nr:hypothetical protein CSOJ01_08603 [Colletotrichum sojae]
MPFWSSSSISFSSSITVNGKTQAHRYVRQSQTTPEGSTVKTASQRLGQPAYFETRQYDSSGRPIVEGRVLKSGQASRPPAGFIEEIPDQKQ